LPRSSPSKIALKVASSWGIITPAAAPWMTRAPINISGLCARPAVRLASPNTAMPAQKRRLRPSRSPKLPAMIRTAAKASM
jgi:hypothetical protein